MKYSRTTARNRPAEELCIAVLGPHDKDWPDVWARGKMGQLLAWEVRRHRDSRPPTGPLTLRVVEVVDFPRIDGYMAIARPDLERRELTLGALLAHLDKYEAEARATGGYIAQQTGGD